MESPTASFLTQLKDGYALTCSTFADGLLLAVSGGADSVALLAGTLQILPKRHSKIVIGHVNHSLRGHQSDDDENFVRKLAANAGIEFESVKVETGSLKSERKSSLEESARRTRYEWLTDCAARRSLKFVVTAHHADDQAETILHNIIRGTGIRGLAGMNSVRQLDEDVSLIRPMLQITRNEIDRFIIEGAHEFTTDETNLETRFTRNRLRNQLIPLLRKDYNSQIVKSLLSLGRQADDSIHCMNQLADQMLSAAVLEVSATVCRLNTTQMSDWPTQLIRHAMVRLWTNQDWPRQKMTFDHWTRLQEVIVAESESNFQLPGSIDVQRSRDLLRLTRPS